MKLIIRTKYIYIFIYILPLMINHHNWVITNVINNIFYKIDGLIENTAGEIKTTNKNTTLIILFCIVLCY